jgi:hypothetical protein
MPSPAERTLPLPITHNIFAGTYAWTAPADRPAKPLVFSQEMMERFLASNYAQQTTLAAFLLAHPGAMAGGVLNQLHRRHIIPWDLIKSFTLKCAVTNFNQNLWQIIVENFRFFRVEATARDAGQLAHGVARAAAWTAVANSMCWVESNVFVGPSAGNVGVGLDQADEMSEQDRRDILVGPAWQRASTVFGSMTGMVAG